MKRLKIKEKEKRQKLKEAIKPEENRKLSQVEVTKTMKKLAKGGKTTILKVGVFYFSVCVCYLITSVYPVLF